MKGPEDAIVAFATFPDADVARTVCRALLEEGLIACANIVPGVRSLYLWNGKVEDDSEALSMLKTTRGRLGALELRFLELHPYDTPELVALEPAHVEARYLAWLRGSVRGQSADEGAQVEREL